MTSPDRGINLNSLAVGTVRCVRWTARPFGRSTSPGGSSRCSGRSASDGGSLSRRTNSICGC